MNHTPTFPLPCEVIQRSLKFHQTPPAHHSLSSQLGCCDNFHFPQTALVQTLSSAQTHDTRLLSLLNCVALYLSRALSEITVVPVWSDHHLVTTTGSVKALLPGTAQVILPVAC